VPLGRRAQHPENIRKFPTKYRIIVANQLYSKKCPNGELLEIRAVGTQHQPLLLQHLVVMMRQNKKKR
jgi:hypothetical protein